MKPVRVALVGAGFFGANHARVISEMPEAALTGILDLDAGRAQALASRYSTRALSSLDEVLHKAECAIVATPTVTHEALTARLLAAGLDVLVEKPIAHNSEAGGRLNQLATEHGRILQVGHLERFNPAITALQDALTTPLFFEVHRLSVFTPRSLDVDVVLDLMIHDLDIVLTCSGETPIEVRAAGISVLSPLVDIANVRLAFPSGCIANLTASRISTERVRKLRVFQPGEYISVDYQRQDALRLAISQDKGAAAAPQIQGGPLPVNPGEPLKLELAAFFDAVRSRVPPRVTAAQATEALHLAETILGKIEEHAQLVAETIRRTR
ncbi:MAG TPA: Gfo/Idh/MocA family oxidoreductase [Bryobacteraceae bacterium]|nr:Gfo/Idh/MocA family oxidoreductase [Bryobacteraceae bacterium]